MRTLLVVSLLLAFSGEAYGDRCASYKLDVRREHARYFGVNFPWWYAVAQLKKESGCRDITSRDGVGSEGAAQITYRWWKAQLDKEGIPEIRSRTNHVRAQAYINYTAWKQTPHKKLWVMFQIYNGGGLVLKEIARAGVVDHAAARKECRRKIITFDNGQRIDACDINYGYPVKIHSYAEPYRLAKDDMEYW